MPLNPSLKRLLSLSCLLALAACGGGGGGSETAGSEPGGGIDQPSGAAKYVGTWVACTPVDATHSIRSTHVIPPMASDVIRVNSSVEILASADCSGPVTGRQEVVSDVGWLGATKVVDGTTADKVGVAPRSSITSGSITLIGDPLQPFNQVIALVDGRLREGDLNAIGLDGFPEQLSATLYIKQP
ncbi:hypothetical protein ACT80S_11650 [Ramlibacter sp. MAHUQ-53]|uniref:hypothetical protein n=1 Tax=unclassified Ramlibacter TaxID=2617605 RepID=UPI00362DFC9B